MPDMLPIPPERSFRRPHLRESQAPFPVCHSNGTRSHRVPRRNSYPPRLPSPAPATSSKQAATGADCRPVAVRVIHSPTRSIPLLRRQRVQRLFQPGPASCHKICVGFEHRIRRRQLLQRQQLLLLFSAFGATRQVQREHYAPDRPAAHRTPPARPFRGFLHNSWSFLTSCSPQEFVSVLGPGRLSIGAFRALQQSLSKPFLLQPNLER